MGRFLQDIAPLVQLKPDVVDAFDTDDLAQNLALWRGMPRTSIRKPEDVQAMRQSRQEQEQLAQAAAVAEPLSKSLLNVSQAQAQPLVQ